VHKSLAHSCLSVSTTSALHGSTRTHRYANTLLNDDTIGFTTFLGHLRHHDDLSHTLAIILIPHIHPAVLLSSHSPDITALSQPHTTLVVLAGSPPSSVRIHRHAIATSSSYEPKCAIIYHAVPWNVSPSLRFFALRTWSILVDTFCTVSSLRPTLCMRHAPRRSRTHWSDLSA
jgi:hypothetical protein